MTTISSKLDGDELMRVYRQAEAIGGTAFIQRLIGLDNSVRAASGLTDLSTSMTTYHRLIIVSQCLQNLRAARPPGDPVDWFFHRVFPELSGVHPYVALAKVKSLDDHLVAELYFLSAHPNQLPPGSRDIYRL